MIKYSKYLLILVLAFASCKSTKIVTANSKLKKLNTKAVLRKYNANLFKGKTLQAKLKITYKSDKESITAMARLRLEKDKTIWISLSSFGIQVAKMQITPNGVTFYEKLHKSFFDGNFSLIEKWLGMPMNFQNLQDVLLGQAFVNLQSKEFKTSIYNQSYELKGKEDYANTILWLNADNFKINKQKIDESSKEKSIKISYNNYKLVGDDILPYKIMISTKDKSKNTNVIINFKTIQTNLPLRFPFTIPKGFKEIKLNTF